MNYPSSKPRLLGIAMVVGLSVAAVGVAWFFRPAPIETGADLLSSQNGYGVHVESYGIFYMPDSPLGIGLIFYTEARVPPEAYAWLGAGLAAKGHPVYLVKSPLNFANFAPKMADAIRQAHPEIERWAVGGHGLGGQAAALYAHGTKRPVAALVLLAAVPPPFAGLATTNLQVLLVSASEDGLLSDGKLRAAESVLPPTTRHVVIQGGNHAQFGEYGPAEGDGKAMIDGGRQRAMVLDSLASFLDKVAAIDRPAAAVQPNSGSGPTAPGSGTVSTP